MIGLAANPGPFFLRVNPNAAEFTPHFNKICDWNSGLFYPHQYLLVSFSALATRSLDIMEQLAPNERLNNKCYDHVSQISPSHHYIHRVCCLHARMATCDGNEEGLASFAVRDSNTAQLAAAHFGNAAVAEIRLPLGSHFR